MAVEFEVKGTRTSEYGFLPEELEIIPEMNGRHELPDVQWIVDSILRHGQLQPITIRRTGGKPVLVAGFSRWRAVNEINSKGLSERPLRLRCSYTALNEKQAFLANIEENRVRNQTTPMDDAYNIQRLINVYQMTEQEVADSYRETVTWIKGRLSLIELVPEAEKAVRDGRVKTSAAKEIAKLSGDLQKKVVKKEGKITAKDVREVKPEATTKRPASKDKELLKLVNAVLEDVVGGLLEDESLEYIEIDRKLLVNLANYVAA
jgi:ParB/RepB/Spo0J family partition protein